MHSSATDGHPAGARGPFQALYPQHRPPPGALAGTQNGYALDSECLNQGHHNLHHAAHPAAYVRRHGMAQKGRWMSWPTDTEQTVRLSIANLQTQANKLRGMHWPREGDGPAYSIFQGRNTPKASISPMSSTRTGAIQTMRKA